MFRYLKLALSLILVFVGVKMMLGHTPYKIRLDVALGIIVATLVVAMIASVWAVKRERRLEARQSGSPDQDSR